MLHSLLLAALFTSVAAIGEDGVLALTDATFNDFVGKDTPALVEFYAPCTCPGPRRRRAAAGAARRARAAHPPSPLARASLPYPSFFPQGAATARTSRPSTRAPPRSLRARAPP